MAEKSISGNWRAFESASYRGEWGVETDDEKLVATGEEILLYPNHSEDLARLVAAAPDMLKALKGVHADHTYETASGYINCRFCDCNTDHEGTFRDTHDEDCLIRSVRAAIAKAEGRS